MTDLPDSDNGENFLPAEIVTEYLRIRNENKVEGVKYYFREIMPRIRDPIVNLETHREFRNSQTGTLISLMGFSPETTVHATTILRPKKLVILYDGNEHSQKIAAPAIEFLVKEGIVQYFDFKFISIDPFDPQDIYDKVWQELPNHDNVIFDITGGTKVMSATAGALAWELNLPMCYLNGLWDPRSGSSGLTRASRLELKTSPSRSRGYRYRDEAMSAYQVGNFSIASERFEESRRLIDDSFFDLLALRLCRCYAAVADFDRKRLTETLSSLEETLELGGVNALVRGRLEVRSHLDALKQFADGESFVVTAGFAELADLYSKQQRPDFAGLLWYRTMEALVEWRLKKIDPRFKTTKPEWENLVKSAAGPIDSVDDLRQAYAQLGSDENASLPTRVTLQSGFGILCLLTNLAADFRDRSVRDSTGMMMNLAAIRNRSYLAHGFENLSELDKERLAKGANDLAQGVLGDEYAEFEQMRGRLRPRDLRELRPA